MRASGVREVLVYRRDHRYGHHVEISHLTRTIVALLGSSRTALGLGVVLQLAKPQRPSRPGSRRLLHVTIGFVGSCKRQPFLSKLQPRISIDRVASPCRSLLAVLGLACETELFCPTSGSSPGMVNTDCG